MSQSAAVPRWARLLVDFVNTRELGGGGTDAFTDPEALQRWLAEQGLLDDEASVDQDDLTRVTALREALRVAMAAHHDDVPAETGHRLDALARRVSLRVAFTADAPRLVPAGRGVDAALGHLLLAVTEAAMHGSWERLKVCPAETCREAFYDVSKNRSRTWCSMDVCGNRAKTRRYRSRLKATTGAIPR